MVVAAVWQVSLFFFTQAAVYEALEYSVGGAAVFAYEFSDCDCSQFPSVQEETVHLEVVFAESENTGYQLLARFDFSERLFFPGHGGDDVFLKHKGCALIVHNHPGEV